MTRTILITAALALAAMLPTVPAQAQAARTFVSAAGSDSNNCTNVATPCRHFAAAYAATTVGGEIDVLDPANYGALTIDHAVSIQGQGWAPLSPGISGAAISINVPSMDAVNLSGFLIDGAGTGVIGIQFTGGPTLTIENCVIRHVLNDGIDFEPTGTSNLSISDSLISDNGLSGIAVGPTGSGMVTARSTASKSSTMATRAYIWRETTALARSMLRFPIAYQSAMQPTAITPLRPQAMRRPRCWPGRVRRRGNSSRRSIVPRQI